MSLDSKSTLTSKLAQFLRKNGHKVINGSCKLSLTTSALCLLNTLFWDLLDDEGSYNPSILQESEISEDVQFLYSFIKRTTTLKLFHGVQTLRGGVDLSHFTNLTVLELRKIPAHLIIGLDLLSEQLKALICSRSIYLLKELFVCSMDGPDVIKPWTELKELNLSYNYLENLDQSLKSLPNIEILNLSHNHIKNTEEIKILKNLCFVNLSYNELDHLPVFSIESCRHLTKLFLKNNNLENIDGLECVFNLEELDLSYNLLSEYSALSPLQQLKSLKMLNVEGNPLFFHNRHVALISAYINKGVLNRGLRLNGKLFAVLCLMTSSSLDLSGSSAFNHQTSINTVVGNAESTTCVPEVSNMSKSSSSSDFGNSISSIASHSGNDLSPILKRKSPKKYSHKSNSTKKSKKRRETLIKDPVYTNEDEFAKSHQKEENVPSHIIARQVVEARRLERGESWLIPDHSRPNLNVYPPKVPSNTPVINNLSMQMSPDSNLTSKITDCLSLKPSASFNIDVPDLVASKEMAEILDIVPEDSSELPGNDKTRCGSRESDDIEILACDPGHCLTLHEQLSPIQDNLSDCDIYEYSKSTYSNPHQEEEVNSDEESEDKIFFVENLEGSKRRPLSVTISRNYIREKDVITGKYLENLDLNSLLITNVTSNKEEGKILHEVEMEFDTVKASKQKRQYLMENLKCAQDMLKILQPFAEAKTLKDMTLDALECLKCNSQFSKQAAHKKLIKSKKPLDKMVASSFDSNKEYHYEIDACPNCSNHILVEMETLPLPSVAMPSGTNDKQLSSTKNSSDRSPDAQSTGSASSGNLIANLFSSIKSSPILKRKSVPFLQAEKHSAPRSEQAGNSSENDDSMNLTHDVTMRRNSSDITIISNPSQNSITIPDTSVELNLNTITEKDSQTSLSPTISQANASNRIIHTQLSDQSNKNAESANAEITQKAGFGSANEEEHDFYSITESLVDENTKQVISNEVLSSGSEFYQSPMKSKRTSIQSEEIDECSQIINILGEKTIITHEMFSELDHRLKLHLEFNVFSEDEQLEACLQTFIVPLSTGEEFKGLFALSSSKVYVIKFLPHYNTKLEQNESMEKILLVVHTCLLSELRQVKVILGNQGLTILCQSQVFTLVIRDADICNSFSSLLSDITQNITKVEFFSSTSETLKQLESSVFANEVESRVSSEVLLHLFAFFQNRSIAGETSLPVCVIITKEDVFISKILYKKQDSCSDLKELCVYYYSVVDHQKISDLISMELKKDLWSVNIDFLNESSSENCNSISWTIKMETKCSLFSFINAVKGPWEEIFKVPLPLTCEKE